MRMSCEDTELSKMVGYVQSSLEPRTCIIERLSPDIYGLAGAEQRLAEAWISLVFVQDS